MPKKDLLKCNKEIKVIGTYCKGKEHAVSHRISLRDQTQWIMKVIMLRRLLQNTEVA